ncbi:taf-6.2, partial [Pristionchus pacificus]
RRMDGSFDDSSIPGTSTQATPPATPPNPELRRIYGVQYPNADFVRRVGDVCGVPAASLDDRVAGAVADAIRSHLRDIIREAGRFAVHGRRARMIPQDLDDALRLMGVQQPLYGMRTQHGEPFRFAGSAGKELVWRDEGEVELAAIIHAAPPRMPCEPQLKPHWLVIDGVQPAVPENPVPPAPLDILTGRLNSAGERAGGASKEERGERTEGARTLTTHSLSLEQQVFFKEVVESVIGHDADRRNEALHCLQTDRGLQSMAPRFVLTIVEGVRTNIGCRNLHCLQQLLLMTHALMNNRTINMSRVVHDLLPAVISCAVARRLSARPAFDNHWAVREAAGKLVARMCSGMEMGVLRSRVAYLFTKRFGAGGGAGRPKPAMATLYGSVFGLSELGLETVRTLIVPRAQWLWDECQRAMVKREQPPPPEKKAAIEDESSQEEVDSLNDDRKAASKMIEMVTGVLIKYVRATRPASMKDLADYTAQLGGFAAAVYKETVTDMVSDMTSSAAAAASSSSSRPSTSHHTFAPSGSAHPRPTMQHRLPVATATPRGRVAAPGYGYGSGSGSGAYRPQQQQPRGGQYQGQPRYM